MIPYIYANCNSIMESTPRFLNFLFILHKLILHSNTERAVLSPIRQEKDMWARYG